MSEQKERRRMARALLKKGIGEWENIDLSTTTHPKWMSRCFKNNKYVVMVNDNAETSHGTAMFAMVQLHTNAPIKLHWREMQKIKNELFGEDAVAVEYYPATDQLIDQHNIYWMWIYPEGILPIPFSKSLP